MAEARQRIEDAAVALFVAEGYASTSMERVRRAAGVSNGSLYHFFPRKADLAAGLIVDGLGDYQRSCLAELRRHDDAASGIAGMVRAHLRWIERHADLARFLFSDVPDEVVLAAEPALGAQNRAFVAELRLWLEPHQAAGTVRAEPWDVVHAIWLGPAQELSRQWLRGRGRTRPARAAAALGDAAATALGAGSVRTATRAPTARGAATSTRARRRPTARTAPGKGS